LAGVGSLSAFAVALGRFNKRAGFTRELQALEARRRELVRKIEDNANTCACDVQSVLVFESASSELARIDARLEEIRHELRKRSLAAPRALTIGGLAAAPGLAALGLAVSILSAFGDDWEGDRTSPGERFGAVLLFASPVALVVGLAGIPWLVRTKRERRPFVLEQHELKARRRDLTTFQPIVTPTSLGLSLKMRF
jgi:hypothetical protein